MISQELSRQLAQISALISKSKSLNPEELELQSHWAKYICVLAAGFLENSIHEIYSGYCSVRVNPRIARFASRALGRIQNPKATAFLDVADSFDENWKDDLETFMDTDGRKEAIGSIMGNRNLIAHGRTTNISLSQLKEYLSKSVEVLEFIEAQCGVKK